MPKPPLAVKRIAEKGESCSFWTRRGGQFHFEQEDRRQANVEAKWKRIIFDESRICRGRVN
eukprot:190813-Karenia_brevis.AAC.1